MVWNKKVLPKTLENGTAVLDVQFDAIPKDTANTEANYALRFYFGNKIKGRKEILSNFNELVIKGKGESKPLEIALITKNAEIYGQTIQVDPQFGDYRISLSDLAATQLVTLPRPYPDFLPYYFERGEVGNGLDLSQIESIQISIGPGLSAAERAESYALQIESIRLE